MALVSRATKRGGTTNYIGGQLVDVNEINPDYNTWYSEFNGNLQNVNVSGTAAIDRTKLAAGGAFVSNSTTQSLTDSISTAITCDTESYDTDAYHSIVSSTSLLTVPTTGYYAFGGTLSFAVNATGFRSAALRKNSLTALTQQRVPTTPASDAYVTVATVAHLTAGDFIQILGTQTSGGSLNCQAIAFWIALLGV